MFYRVLAGILTILLVLTLATSCGNKGTEETDLKETDEAANGTITEIPVTTSPGDQAQGFVIENKPLDPVWEFTASTGAPYISPMGAESNYESFEDAGNGNFYFAGYDADQQAFDREIHGDLYRMEVAYREALDAGQNKQFIYDLKQFALKTGWSIEAQNLDGILLMAEDEDHNKWWCMVQDTGYVFELSVVKELELKENKPLVLKPSDLESPVTLASYHNGKSYQVLDASISNGFADLSIETQIQSGEYRWESNQRLHMDESIGIHYTLGSLANVPTYSTWEIWWDSYDPPEEIRLALTTPLEIEPLQYGESLGAIKVSSEFVYAIYATQTGGSDVYLTHPSYEMEGTALDRTPEGDYLMYLPAGYWDIKIIPEGDPVLDSYQMMAVPVSSGMVTEVSVPYRMALGFSKGTIDADDRGIEIRKVDENPGNGQVTFEFTLLDQTTSDIEPDLKNTKVSEGGEAAELVSIEPVLTPPNVVLLLDTSGSMRGSFEGVIKSAKQFVGQLPENSVIRIVDFDSTVKVLKGTTISEAVKGLEGLSVGGDTALYNSLFEGVRLLESEERPILVLFTDGENDLRDPGPNTLETTLDAMKAAGIPIYAIGFGKGHDSGTLIQFAETTNGAYFNAEDQEALNRIFTAINERIGSTYKVIYKRPEKPAPGDIPVLSVMVDTSGSMEETDDGMGERMHNVKELLHPFVMNLPHAVQMQLMGFEEHTYMIQSLTTDKTRLIRAIDSMRPGGGTEIPKAVHMGIESLMEVPSTKKILVLITDAALDIEAPGMDAYFKKLRDENIKTLWVGMGLGQDLENEFGEAALRSGGAYVFSSDPKELSAALDAMINEVVTAPESGLSQLTVTVEKENELGEREAYGTSQLVTLSEVPAGDWVIDSQTITYKTGIPLKSYDASIVANISGRSVPGVETIVTGRMPTDKSKTGSAVAMAVQELIFMKKLAGVEAPTGYRFLGLVMSLENVLPSQKVTLYEDGSGHPANWVAGDDAAVEVDMVPDYLIPDFTAHFFLNYNQAGSFPAHHATWLTEGSISIPGDPSILVTPEQVTQGTLVFLVPDEPVERLSLHLFDTAYGSTHLPVVGKLEVSETDLDAMPTDIKTELLESFNLALVSIEESDTFPIDTQLESENRFRIVNGTFVSNMQALLEINPAEMIQLEIKTGSGNVYLPLHPGTANLPFGQYNLKKIGPGANNLSRWMFELPMALAGNQSNLYINLSGRDARLPLGGDEPKDAAPLATIESDGYDIAINNLGFYNEEVVLDVTVRDLEDGFSTQGVASLFEVHPLEDGNPSLRAYFSETMDNLLLKMDDDVVIFDGTERRGLITFYVSDPSAQWRLTSSVLDGLDLTVENKPVDSGLLASRTAYEVDESFDQAVSKAIAGKIALTEEARAISLDSGVFTLVPIPSFTELGKQKLDSVRTVEDGLAVLKSLRYIPTTNWLQPFEHVYSPEATITQGFGSENDYAALAIRLLSQAGVEPKMRLVSLTERGKSALESFSGGVEVLQDEMPAVYYEKDGKGHLLVLPFVEELGNLEGFCTYMPQEAYELTGDRAYIKVSVEGIDLKEDMSEQMSDFSDALAGETDDVERLSDITVLEGDLDLSLLSEAPLDLGFIPTATQWKAYWIHNGDLTFGSETVSMKNFDPKRIVITVQLGSGDPYTSTISLGPGRKLEDIFATLAVNSPELPEKPQLSPEKEMDDYTAMRLYTRSILYNFIHAQTIEERRIASQMGLVTGNTNEARIIVVAMKAPRPETSMVLDTTIDLVNPVGEVHTGKSEARHAFEISSGLYATALEDTVLGEQGLGVMDILYAAPEGTKLILMEPYHNGMSDEALVDAGFGSDLIAYFSNCENMVLIPNKPSTILGRDRWAWIEINPDTYETIGVLDTFEHGGMVSSVIVDLVRSSGQFALGGYVGITSSVWAVAGFSLEEDDYETILKEAQSFTLGLLDNFGVSYGPIGLSVGGTPKISQQFGPVEASFDGSFGLSQNILGFTQGFEAGVKYYFATASR